jgi:WD40 repeat protein
MQGIQLARPPIFHIKMGKTSVSGRPPAGHIASVTAVDWYSVDNGIFVSASRDSTVKLWDPNTVENVSTFQAATPVAAVAMARAMGVSSKLAAVGCADSCVRLIDIASGVPTHTLEGAAPRSPGTCLPGPDVPHRVLDVSSRVAVGQAYSWRRALRCLWLQAHSFPCHGAVSRKMPLQMLAAGCQDNSALAGRGGAVFCVTWCRSNAYQLAAGNASGHLRLWDIRRAGVLHHFDCANMCGTAIAASDTDRVDIGTTRSAQARCSGTSAEDVAVAPGGHEMLSTQAGCALAHQGAVTGLLQTPDGRHWVTAGTDDAARLWDTHTWHNCLVRYPEAFNSANGPRQIAVDDSSQVCSP